MIDTLSSAVLAWLLTYLIHSTALLLLAWVLTRLRIWSPAAPSLRTRPAVTALSPRASRRRRCVTWWAPA